MDDDLIKFLKKCAQCGKSTHRLRLITGCKCSTCFLCTNPRSRHCAKCQQPICDTHTGSLRQCTDGKRREVCESCDLDLAESVQMGVLHESGEVRPGMDELRGSASRPRAQVLRTILGEGVTGDVWEKEEQRKLLEMRLLKQEHLERVTFLCPSPSLEVVRVTFRNQFYTIQLHLLPPNADDRQFKDEAARVDMWLDQLHQSIVNRLLEENLVITKYKAHERGVSPVGKSGDEHWIPVEAPDLLSDEIVCYRLLVDSSTDNSVGGSASVTPEECGISQRVFAAHFRATHKTLRTDSANVPLQETLAFVKGFYAAQSSLQLGDVALSPSQAAREASRWELARESVASIAALKKTSADKAAAVARLTVGTLLHRLSGAADDTVYIPLFWKQKYCRQISEKTVRFFGGEDDDGDEKDNDPKYEKLEETSVLWLALSHGARDDRVKRFTLRFYNTSAALAHLFGECKEVFVPSFRSAEFRSGYVPRSVAEGKDLLGSLITDGIPALSGMLGPGVEDLGAELSKLGGAIGYNAALQFEDVDESTVRLALFTLLLMVREEYDDPVAPMSLAEKLVSLVEETNNEEPNGGRGEAESSESGSEADTQGLADVLGSSNASDAVFKILKHRGLALPLASAALDEARHARLRSTPGVAIETLVCKALFENRSAVDNSPLSGQASHVVEAVFALLQDGAVSHKRAMLDVPPIPLQPGISTVRSLELFEQLSKPASVYRLSLLRSVYLLRSAKDVLKSLPRAALWDAVQFTFRKAMKQPELLSNSTDSQRRELAGLKIFLDTIAESGGVGSGAMQLGAITPSKLAFKRSVQIGPVARGLEKLDMHVGAGAAEFVSGKAYFSKVWHPPAMIHGDVESHNIPWREMSLPQLKETWTKWLGELDRLAASGDASALRSVLWCMLEQVPKCDDEGFFASLHRPSIVNVWARAIYRVAQHVIGSVFARLSAFLDSEGDMKTWSLFPEELLAVCQTFVFLDRLYVSDACDAKYIHPELTPFAWEFIIEHLASDQYLELGSARANDRLVLYLKYMEQRKRHTSGIFLDFSGMTMQMTPVEEAEEAAHGYAEQSILEVLTDLVAAAHGGDLPTRDEKGQPLMNPSVERAFRMEDTYKNEKIKKGVTAQQGILKTMWSSVEQENKAMKVKSSEVKKGIAEAKKWLEDAYAHCSRIFSPMLTAWLDTHVGEEIQLTSMMKSVGAVLRSLPMGTEGYHDPLAPDTTGAEHRTGEETASLIRGRLALFRVWKNGSKLQKELETMRRELLQICISAAIESNVGVAGGPRPLNAANVRSAANALLAQINIFLADDVAMGIMEEGVKAVLQSMLDPLRENWTREDSLYTFRASFMAEEFMGAANVTFKPPSSNVAAGACRQIVHDYCHLRQLMDDRAVVKKEGHSHVLAQAVLFSNAYQKFWPPTLYGLLQVSLLSRYVINPVGSAFSSTSGNLFFTGLKGGARLLGRAIGNLFRGGYLPSSRQAAYALQFSFLAKIRELLGTLRPPTIGFSFLSTPNMADGIIAKYLGAVGVWVPMLRVGDEDTLLALLNSSSVISPNSKNAGVPLGDDIRKQLVLTCIENKLRGEQTFHSNDRILAEQKPFVEELRGMVDVCHAARFDHGTVEWLHYFFNRYYMSTTPSEFTVTNWIGGADGASGEDFMLELNAFEREKLLLVLRRLGRYMQDINVRAEVYNHWQRMYATDLSTLMHVIFGEFSQERLSKWLSNDEWRRVVELRLFRPTLLRTVCALKPQFCQSLMTLLNRAVRQLERVQDLSGELYVRWLAARVSAEVVPLALEYSHIARFICEPVESDPHLNYKRRVLYLHASARSSARPSMAPAAPSGDTRDEAPTSLEESEGISARYQGCIHGHFLRLVYAEVGRTLALNDKRTPDVLASYFVVRASMAAARKDVDRHFLQKMLEWMQGLLQQWQMSLVSKDGRVDEAALRTLLSPTVQTLAPEACEMMGGVERLKWTVHSYPLFSAAYRDAQDKQHSLMVEPVGGFVCEDGRMKTFVKFEHASIGLYKRYFGPTPLACFYERRADWDVYTVSFPDANGKMGVYEIHARGGATLEIFRQLERDASKRSSWYRYSPTIALPPEIYDNDAQKFVVDDAQVERALDGVPGFLYWSESWVGDKRVYFSWSVHDKSQARVIHHSAKRSSVSHNEPASTISHVRREPSGELCRTVPSKSIPDVVAAFEHSVHMEWTENGLHLPRFGLSFVYDGDRKQWLSDQYPGFRIYDGKAVDPFGDGSRFWIVLERCKMQGGNSRYLLIASIRPLWAYDSADPSGWRSRRQSSRAVWMGLEITREGPLPHFTVQLSVEGRLVSASSEGKVWLAWLLLAKRDYHQCSISLREGLTDSHLSQEQLSVLRSMLAWYDVDVNACLLKLKIVAHVAARHPRALHPKKELSLLGMDLGRFFDVYVTALQKVEQNRRRIAENEGASSRVLIHLTKWEWHSLERCVARLAKGVLFGALGQIGRDPDGGWTEIPPCRHYEEAMVAAHQLILGSPSADGRERSEVEQLLSRTLTIRDAAVFICENFTGSKTDRTLLDQLTPHMYGEQDHAWAKSFVSVFNHIAGLDAKKSSSEEEELFQWLFLLASERCGDRVDWLMRILLFEAVYGRLQGLKLHSFPSDLVSRRVRVTNRLGMASIGARKDKDSEKVDAVEAALLEMHNSVHIDPKTLKAPRNPNPGTAEAMGGRILALVPAMNEVRKKWYGGEGAENTSLDLGSLQSLVSALGGVDINEDMLRNLADGDFDGMGALLPAAAALLPAAGSLLGKGLGDGAGIEQLGDMLDGGNPLSLLGIGEGNEKQLLHMQQRQESVVLEATLAARSRAMSAEVQLYPTVTTEMSELRNIRDKHFSVKVVHPNEAVIRMRENELFGTENYDQAHHQRSAALLRGGFHTAALRDTEDIILVEEHGGLRALRKQLISLKAALEETEEVLTRSLNGVVRRPGQVSASGVTADLGVPIATILTAWETNSLSKLNTEYDCALVESEMSEVNKLAEQLDVCLCWRYHIEMVVDRVSQLGKCSHPCEKQALIEAVYAMLSESLCYVVGGTAPHGRKILALCRANRFLVRQKQVHITNQLLKNPNQAMQAPLGMGKSSVIVPLLVTGLSDGVRCAWTMCPLHDKPDTLRRAEALRVMLDHPVLVFHFAHDGTHSATEVTVPGHRKGARAEKKSTNLYPPYDVTSVESMRDLYNDLLRVALERGCVVTTRESLLYFVDMYEHVWLKRARATSKGDTETVSSCDDLIDVYSKFFPFMRRYCRGILDEIDEILKSNIKVNIALTDRAKINRDTLHLAVECVRILLDPEETLEYPAPVTTPGSILTQSSKTAVTQHLPITSVLPLLDNCQAVVSAGMKQAIRYALCKRIGAKEFDISPQHERHQDYMAYVLCLEERHANRFYHTLLEDQPTRHPRARDIVRLRELLGGSFATLFKRHNYALGRMFTNENPDDVGPYSAANTPIQNSHLSSEYDWAWALAVNYAMSGVTVDQLMRYVSSLKDGIMNASVDDSLAAQYGTAPPSSSKSSSTGSSPATIAEEARRFEARFDVSVLQITSSMMPSLLQRVNDLGVWPKLDYLRVSAFSRALYSPTAASDLKVKDNELKELRSVVPKVHLIMRHTAHECRRAACEKYARVFWGYILRNQPDLTPDKESWAIEQYRAGIQSRLDFLETFVNLDYFPYYIEGNAGTIVDVFASTCGFSGTMEVPYSLPQSVLRQCDWKWLRDPAIDGVVLSRFLSFALQDGCNPQNDSTRFVDEAAQETRTHRVREAKESSAREKDVLNTEDLDLRRIVDVCLSCTDCQAIVDGGALLDVRAGEVVDVLSNRAVLSAIQSGDDKAKIDTIRWKDDSGQWTTKDVAGNRIVQQRHRIDFNLTSTLTFYDQQHSRGTDAKLQPDALMVNTVGDETRLTDWSQAEGRARQSGKGQTSKSVIAPHVRKQLRGDGPLSIRMLRELLKRSADSEVSEAFYAHAEQVRGYLRDAIRFAFALSCMSPSPNAENERRFLGYLAEEFFTFRCDTDLAAEEVLQTVAAPYQYDTSLRSLKTLIGQQQVRVAELMDGVNKSTIIGDQLKRVFGHYIQRGVNEKLNAHQFPPEDALPGGMMGVPRPGEQSFGIVMNTEIAQEQQVEIEQEVEMESELVQATDAENIGSQRPLWVNWPSSALKSTTSLFEALDSSPFIKVFGTLRVYNHARVSSNLGITRPSHSASIEPSWFAFSGLRNSYGAAVESASSNDENRFRWLHDTYIDPFTYHMILQHPIDGFKCATVCHQEVTEYLFPLLSRPTSDMVRITVFRHEGWGWVPFDSTKDPSGQINGVDTTCTIVHRMLSECALLSGNVELGGVTEMMHFLRLFIPDLDTRLSNLPDNLFSPQTLGLVSSLKDVRAFLDTCESFAPVESIVTQLQHIAPAGPEILKQVDARTMVGDLNPIMDGMTQDARGGTLLAALMSPNPTDEWLLYIEGMFADSSNFIKVQDAKEQLRVIASRHCPGINRKLNKSPMWKLLNGILKHLDPAMTR